MVAMRARAGGLLIAMLAASAAPGLAQTLPPISRLLPQVGVEAPAMTDVVDPATRQASRRLAGPFGISNNSRYDLKDLEIRCSYAAPGGTVIGDHSFVAYDIFGAGTRRTTAAVTLPPAPSQARTANCVAAGGVVVALAVGTPQADPCPDCPDLAQLFRTCDCDLAEPLAMTAASERLVVPVRRTRRGAPRR